MTEIMTGSVTLGILAEDWQRHHQPARTPRDRPRRLEALRPMGLAGRRRSDRCSSRLSPAESRSRRRLTPQRLRSRPRLAQSPPRWRTHRRPSHQSVHGLGLPKNEAATREAARGPPPATCRPAPPGSVRSSSQSIRSRRRCGLRVRRNLVDDRGSPLDDSAHRGGSRSCARPSRRRHAGELRTHRCVAAETVPLTSDHFDEMAGRGVRRVRYSGSHWRGHQPHLKRGSALDSPLTPRSASPEAQGRASLRW